MTIKTPTPTQIAALRAKSGLTQSEIAALLHTSDRTWRKWENGERRMRLAMYEAVAAKIDERYKGTR